MKKSLFILGAAVIAASSQATIFSFNGGSLVIDDAGAPAVQNYSVAGLDGGITRVELVIDGISHTFPDDMGAVLVNNVGASALLFDGPGGGGDINGMSWTFDDVLGTATLPNADPLVSGVFLPGQNQWNDTFTNFAGPYGTTMAGLNGGGDGTWTLHVEDFVGGDAGSIQATTLRITTDAVPEPATMTALALGAAALLRRRRSK